MNTIRAILLVSSCVAMIAGPAQAQVDVLPSIPKGNISINLATVASGLGAPDYATSAPGDVSRLFVVEQKGTVLVLQGGSILATPALDLQTLIGNSFNAGNANDERGLLGLAFHPGFNSVGSPGYRTLYTFSSQPLGSGVTYAAPNNATQNFKTVVNEWKMSVADPNVVDPASRREVISFGKNASNHNGGTIAFGPDGYLYLGLGDGGNANDVGASHLEPGGNAQNLSTPLGKMLRIDPLNPNLTTGSSDATSLNGQYRIPMTNPFQQAGQVAEIYAYGLRNPYRFAFDRLNGQLIAGDVGQNAVEEIDLITLGGNYGWGMKEGDFLFNRATGSIGARSPGSPMGLIDPITGTLGTLQYDHQDGISITGGFVYRGTQIPELYGKYVFGDLALNTGPRADGRLFYADLTTGQIFEFLLPQFAGGVLPNELTVHGFGEDASGELYALVTNTPANGTGGLIYKFGAVPEPATASLLALGIVGLLSRRSRRKSGSPLAWMSTVLSLAAVTAQGAVATLTPSQDASIFSESENSNGAGSLYAGRTPTDKVRRALLQFDFAGSGIPAGSTIDSVTLTLTQTKIGPGVVALFELHPLLAAWGEGSSTSMGVGDPAEAGDATWNARLFDTANWIMAGGDFGATSGSTTMQTSNMAYTFTSQSGMVSDVQNWLNNPASNFGWMLKAANETIVNAREFGSSENGPSQRPSLTINYTPAPEPGSAALLAFGGMLCSGRRRRT